MGFLDAQFAGELLEAVSGRQLRDAPGFADLIEHLGGHALAVELAGAFLGAYTGETPAGYHSELQAGGGIEAEASEFVRYNRTVSQAFTTLWSRLDEATRAAWRLASWFEAEPVTAELSDTVGLTRPETSVATTRGHFETQLSLPAASVPPDQARTSHRD